MSDRPPLTPREQLEAQARAKAWAKMKPKPKPTAKKKRKPKPRQPVTAFSCPTCGAPVGAPCRSRDGEPHARRVSKAVQASGQPTRRGSVWATPSATETNRRRH